MKAEMMAQLKVDWTAEKMDTMMVDSKAGLLAAQTVFHLAVQMAVLKVAHWADSRADPWAAY